MKGFLNFVREQGIVGLAVGFILGGSVSKVVTALVSDIVNPLIALALGGIKSLSDAYWQIGEARILWGDFLNVFIDFLVIAFVVYFGVKWLKLDRLDKKKS